MDNYSLKKIYSRKLKNGKYVIVANKSNPLVVDEEIITPLLKGDISSLKNDKDTLNVFIESNFFSIGEGEDENSIPQEKDNIKWKLMRFILFSIAIIDIIIIMMSIFFIGIPTGDRIYYQDIPVLNFFIFISIFYPIIASLHELMHMIYGRTFKSEFGGLGLSISKGVVFVSMNHIWTWSLWSRFSALVAGIVSDLTLIAFFSILQIIYNCWILTTASAILWAQIIWQFQFYRNCDGHLMALTILDDPFIHIDAYDRNIKKTKQTYIWKLLNIIGYGFSLVLAFFWVIPFIKSIFILLF